MTNIDIMSKVLKVQLCLSDVTYIKEYYRAFYESPEEYEGDKLCDMILKDIGKEEEVNNEVGGITMERLSSNQEMLSHRSKGLNDILEGIPGLAVKGYSPDTALCWGKLNDSDVYVRKIPRGKWYPYVSQMVENIEEYEAGLNFSTNALFKAHVYQGHKDYVVYVGDLNVGNPNEIAPHDYIYAGSMYLDNKSLINEECLINIQQIFVPFSRNDRGLSMPVIWNNMDPIFDVTEVSIPAVDKIVSNGLLMLEAIDEVAGTLRDALPAVDLDTERLKRYADVSVGSLCVTYNRNHRSKATGNVSNIMLAMPFILLEIQRMGTENIIQTNLIDYITGKIERDDLIFLTKIYQDSLGSDRVEVGESKTTDAAAASSSVRSTHHGGSMLDAVKTSAGSIRE